MRTFDIELRSKLLQPFIVIENLVVSVCSTSLFRSILKLGLSFFRTIWLNLGVQILSRVPKSVCWCLDCPRLTLGCLTRPSAQRSLKWQPFNSKCDTLKTIEPLSASVNLWWNYCWHHHSKVVSNSKMISFDNVYY